MEEEKIKSLLIESKYNPKKLLELDKYPIDDVVGVAIKNELYDPLMMAFQPITIDGEIRICLDAFSSKILSILQSSYDTKEQAVQEAKQEFEETQERNSKLSEEERQWFYSPTSYEEILKNKIIISKEIKEAFQKVLFTINYEQVSKMKIKNCHARQISGWNHPVETVEDVMVYSELPCLMASIDLFNLNIRTTMNDTECVLEDKTKSNGICEIWIAYKALSEENKSIVEELISSGCAKKFLDNVTETISIFVPCSREETVGEVSDKLRAVVSKFKVQDIKYGFETPEELYQRYAPTIEKYPFYAEGLFSNGINIPDLLELGKRLGENLYYDEEGLIWRTSELYQRHKRYLDAQPPRGSSQGNNL